MSRADNRTLPTATNDITHKTEFFLRATCALPIQKPIRISFLGKIILDAPPGGFLYIITTFCVVVYFLFAMPSTYVHRTCNIHIHTNVVFCLV